MLINDKKLLNRNIMMRLITAILVLFMILGCSKTGRTIRLSAKTHNFVDVVTDDDTVWIIYKNSRNGKDSISKLIRHDSCFYAVSNGTRRLMMSNRDTRYDYECNGNEYRVNISQSPDGLRVTNVFRSSPDRAGFLYSLHYTKELELVKVEVLDTVTYKTH